MSKCSEPYEGYKTLEERIPQIVHPILKKIAPVMQGLIKMRPSDRLSASEAHALVRPILDEYLEKYGNDPTSDELRRKYMYQEWPTEFTERHNVPRPNSDTSSDTVFASYRDSYHSSDWSSDSQGGSPRSKLSGSRSTEPDASGAETEE
jgi:hypothetical protein